MDEALMSDEFRVIKRAFNPDQDRPFIFKSWRDAVWYGETRDEKEAQDFFKNQSREIEALLRDPKISVRIASMAHDHDHLVGYAVLLETRLMFVYVKPDYRKQGIARLLTSGFTTISPPVTRIAKSLAEKLNLKEEIHARESEKVAR